MCRTRACSCIDRRLEILSATRSSTSTSTLSSAAAVGNAEDALAIASRGLALGFNASSGLIHDGHGRVAAPDGSPSRGTTGLSD